MKKPSAEEQIHARLRELTAELRNLRREMREDAEESRRSRERLIGRARSRRRPSSAKR